jgi:hypothetical protein
MMSRFPKVELLIDTLLIIENGANESPEKSAATRVIPSQASNQPEAQRDPSLIQKTRPYYLGRSKEQFSALTLL